jgi:uncharacterized membrane protein SpoIIM required for sporulation
MNSKYFSKPFLVCLAVSFCLIFLCLVVGSFRGLVASQAEANNTYNHVVHLRQTLRWTDIFINNYVITLRSALPIIGIYYVISVQYDTGVVLGNLAQAYHVSNLAYVFSIIVSPVGILEYSAYIFVFAETVMLIYNLWKQTALERWKTQTWKTLLLATALLLVAAYVEWKWFL